jgi:hypothetical protein
MRDYYLASSEAAFRERHIGDFQSMLTKNYNPRVLFSEPWRNTAAIEANPQAALASGEKVVRCSIYVAYRPTFFPHPARRKSFRGKHPR